MKVTGFGKITDRSISDLCTALEAQQGVMYTMTLDGTASMKGLQPEHSNPHVEFRAWTAPFKNFFTGHVNADGAEEGVNLFEIIGDPEEILAFVQPLIRGKVEWQTVNKESRKVRLWLSTDLGH